MIKSLGSSIYLEKQTVSPEADSLISFLSQREFTFSGKNNIICSLKEKYHVHA